MNIPAICTELQNLQRQRSVLIKSRNMQSNRLQAIVAGTLGYSSTMPEAERKKKFADASAVIDEVKAGNSTHSFKAIIETTLIGIDAFNEEIKRLEKAMVSKAKLLPASEWVSRKEQRGFGVLFLAIVIGETGDLHNYPNPGKLWKRLGCAPHTFDGGTRMGATWRAGKEGKLPAEEWEKFGYSPRRRSIAYLIGEGLVKQNFLKPGADEQSSETEDVVVGPYRQRYDVKKAEALANRPDWTRCPPCRGNGKTSTNKNCANCKGTGKVAKRCHLHGMLLATKLLLKNLWIEWHKDRLERGSELPAA